MNVFLGFLLMNIWQGKKILHEKLDLEEASAWSYPAAQQPRLPDSCLPLGWLEAAFCTSWGTAPAHASASPVRDMSCSAVSSTSAVKSTSLSVPGILLRKNGKMFVLWRWKAEVRARGALTLPSGRKENSLQDSVAWDPLQSYEGNNAWVPDKDLYGISPRTITYWKEISPLLETDTELTAFPEMSWVRKGLQEADSCVPGCNIGRTSNFPPHWYFFMWNYTNPPNNTYTCIIRGERVRQKKESVTCSSGLVPVLVILFWTSRI